MCVVFLCMVFVLVCDGGMLFRLCLLFSMGFGGWFGSGQQWMLWIYFDDVVGLIDFFLYCIDCCGVFNVCVLYFVRNVDFVGMLVIMLCWLMFLFVFVWILCMVLGEMLVLLLGSQYL